MYITRQLPPVCVCVQLWGLSGGVHKLNLPECTTLQLSRSVGRRVVQKTAKCVSHCWIFDSQQQPLHFERCMLPVTLVANTMTLMTASVCCTCARHCTEVLDGEGNISRAFRPAMPQPSLHSSVWMLMRLAFVRYPGMVRGCVDSRAAWHACVVCV